MKRKLKFIGVIAIFLFVFGVSASASMITFDLEIEYSGGDPPEGSAPWLSATFEDTVTPGLVQLTMDASGLTGTEFVGAWLFNIIDEEEALLPSLIFTYVNDGSSTGPAAATPVGASADGFNAGPAHEFDIKFDFPEANSGDRFGAGEVVVYDIFAIGLSANLFLADNESGKGPFPSAAHVQGIGTDGEDSGWIAVSEPATMLLLGSGLIGFALIGRRKFFKKG